MPPVSRAEAVVEQVPHELEDRGESHKKLPLVERVKVDWDFVNTQVHRKAVERDFRIKEPVVRLKGIAADMSRKPFEPLLMGAGWMSHYRLLPVRCGFAFRIIRGPALPVLLHYVTCRRLVFSSHRFANAARMRGRIT